MSKSKGKIIKNIRAMITKLDRKMFLIIITLFIAEEFVSMS